MWEVPDTENDASLRFWAIEHIALMIFALFLTQLGRIFIKRATQSIRMFKAQYFIMDCSVAYPVFVEYCPFLQIIRSRFSEMQDRFFR